MDQPPASGVGGGSGGPAPFLLKTYDMVDDSSTDEIVSWCPDKKNSFVVWNPPEFARLLLPTYFKHNNFSSFIRQLNTYGFRKIDPERWEFANEDFVKDQKHLLKNIHRRKPIHSHSQPPGSTVDPERVAFEEEIERLSREKTALEANILRCSQQRSAVQVHFEELTQRFDCMERRQESLLTFLEKAVQEPTFVERLARKLESADVLAYKKKRRLPQADQSQPAAENNLLDDDSSARPEPGSIFDQDFSDKLRLELSPAVSDVNLVSCSTQSSNDDGPCPLRKTSERDPKDTEMRTECPLFAPDPLDISDTGTSFGLKMDSYFPQKVRMDGGSEAQLLHQRFGSGEDADVNVSCQLKLALASSPFQANRNPFSSRTIQQVQEIGKLPESDSNTNTNTIESGTVSFPDSRDAHEEEMSKKISMEAPVKNQEHAAKPVRVNDVFWEQFLTERPGSSDNEEACSSYRANAYEEQEERRSSNAISKSFKSLEQLTL